MRWIHDGAEALTSDCGRYAIAHARVGGAGVAYTAVRLGKPDRDAWSGSAVIGSRTVSAATRAARDAAVEQLKVLCEEHAGER